MPIEHYYGRLSEEFGGALPSVIVEEQRKVPVGFLEQVIEYRAYASAHAANEANTQGWELSPMRTLAMQIMMTLKQEEIDSNG